MISTSVNKHISTFTATENFPLSRTAFWWLLLFALCVSIAIRGIALTNTTLLDDHDSVFYLQSIEAYHSLQWSQVNALNSDSTPTYPFLSSLASYLTGNTEMAGRLISLLSSALLLCAVGFLGARLHSRAAGVVGALILAVNPLEITLSVAVLTEMLYQALVYSGMYLVFRALESRRFTLASAALAATMFGLSFLTKTEGILFIVLCPLIVVIGLFLPSRPLEGVKAPRLFPVTWLASFTLVFLLIATVQIAHVSMKMGSLAINGRIAWQSLVALMPDEPLDAAIYGLDLDESSTNIVFARSHYPEVVQRLSGQESNTSESNPLFERVKLSVKNLDKIYRHLLGDILSPLGLFFLFFGALVVLTKGTLSHIMFFLFVLAGVLVAPILHTSVIPRQMAQAIPVFSIFQAIGVLKTAEFLFQKKYPILNYPVLVTVVLLALAAGQAVPIYKSLKTPTINQEYDPVVLAEPIRILQANSDAKIVAARKAYLGFYSGMKTIQIPFTDMQGLVSYLALNDTQYLYIDFDLLEQFPFVDSFRTVEYQKLFTELWSNPTGGQKKSALYRLNKD